jgi:transposase
MPQTQIIELEQFYKTTKNALEARRALAAKLYLTGQSTDLSGFSAEHAKRLAGAYRKEGTNAFLDKRTSNRDRILTASERNHVVAVLKTKQPRDVITPCTDEQWSTYWLGRYIHETYGKQFKSKTSHYLLFREARLSFHLPGKRYEKASQPARDVWVSQQTDGRSRLMRSWRDKETVILCEDEMVLTSATTLQKIWLPTNTYPPVVETNSTKKRKSIYGFLNLKTGQQHAFMTDWQNMYITVGVLEQLRQAYPTQQLLIIWDNCGWHRGGEVRKWIRKDKHTKTLHFPPYTPDLNPQEHVWKAGRNATTHNKHITDIEQATSGFISYITNRTFAYELCGLRPQISGQD